MDLKGGGVEVRGADKRVCRVFGKVGLRGTIADLDEGASFTFVLLVSGDSCRHCCKLPETVILSLQYPLEGSFRRIRSWCLHIGHDLSLQINFAPMRSAQTIWWSSLVGNVEVGKGVGSLWRFSLLMHHTFSNLERVLNGHPHQPSYWRRWLHCFFSGGWIHPPVGR